MTNKDYISESIEIVRDEELDIDDVVKVHTMKMKEEELKLKREQMEKDKEFKIDWNMVANGAISIVSILLVLGYEKENIITSKSWGIASKLIGRGK